MKKRDVFVAVAVVDAKAAMNSNAKIFPAYSVEILLCAVNKVSRRPSVQNLVPSALNKMQVIVVCVLKMTVVVTGGNDPFHYSGCHMQIYES